MAAQRVLHIISSTMRAGVAVMVMNLYRELDRDKIQFDFVAHDLGNDDFGPEIEKLGGRVFRIPFLSEAGMPGFVRLVRDIIEKNGPYAAVHAHTDYQAGFSALAAKQADVPVRICHAHSDTRSILSPVFLLKKWLGRAMINRYVTQRCACSRNAALSTFGRHMVNSDRVMVVPNRIDLSQFDKCPPQVRADLRDACHADSNTHIIGCVGRLSREKNPSFVLDIAAEAKKAGHDFRFIFVGTGVLLDELKNRCLQMNLDDVVSFLGVRNDVPCLMQCFDMVVVPSFSEGFPFAVLEAQAAGTPVLVTSGVPEEVDMSLGLFRALPLNAGVSAWVKQADAMMKNARPDAAACIEKIRKSGYDVHSNLDDLFRLYGMEP